MKRKLNKSAGFTLIEVMIVVAIIGIITAIAYPAYTNQVTETRRVDAAAALVQLAQAMERYYGVNYTYEEAAAGGADTGAPAATTFAHTQSPFEGTGFYNLRITAATASTFTVQAQPVGVQQTNDTDCGTLSLTNLGLKSAALGSVDDCWR